MFPYIAHIDSLSQSTEWLLCEVPKMEMIELENSLDRDEAAHNELPHLDLHCLPSSLRILNMI